MEIQEEKTENSGLELIDLTIILNDFFRMIRKNWLVLVLVIALGAGGFAFYRNRAYQPVYTASSTFVINTSMDGASGNYYDTSAAQQIAKTFPYILTSDVLQRRVAGALGLSYVPGHIQADVVENTNFLTISVTDADPKQAYETLQAVLEVCPSISESIIGKVYSELMDETGLPETPDNPRNLREDLAKGGLMGLCVGLAYVLILMFTVRTVRCEEDCIGRINTKCLGLVPVVREKVRSRKTEQRLNITRKNIDGEFVEAFRIIRNKIEHRTGKNGQKIILVTSTLAGEGKSTVAVNMALSLLQAGKRVALLDCDMRNPSDSQILGAPAGKGLVDFLRDGCKLSECLVNGRELLDYNVPFLFIRGGERVDDSSGYLSSGKMRKLVEVLAKQVDYLILDSAPAGFLTDAGILAQYADCAVYVVKKDYAKVDKILDAMEQLTENDLEILGCVLNGAG